MVDALRASEMSTQNQIVLVVQIIDSSLASGATDRYIP
jgi:hypothetical protein